MAKGYSLHVGLNRVSSKHYGGEEYRLNVCLNDMEAMYDLAVKQDFAESVRLRDSDATIGAFKSEVKRFSNIVKAGDIFLITFAGHGAQSEDFDGDEGDGFDENWCFYDGFLVDDRLNKLYCRFAKGVRILIVADNCFSGTISKNNLLQSPIKVKKRPVQPTPAACVKLLAATYETKKSYEGPNYGKFTEALLAVWGKGTFKGNYEEFIDEIRAVAGRKQTAMLFDSGAHCPNFDKENPFAI